MNTPPILEAAAKYITGLQAVQPNIFKGSLNVMNKLAGIYYFDLSNKPMDNFESYQEELLADEFYDHPGSLQWNYYLFLLNDNLNDKAKEAIEKNDKYARKYVLTQQEFTDFFTFTKSDAIIRPDIVLEWKEKLDEAGLEDVYLETSYADLQRKFQENLGLVKKPKKKNTLEADKIHFMNQLILKDGYRAFPLQRNYTFGRVNLFRGINGVGKTSLFEAIEAMICGKCLRNPKVVINKGSITAEFNSSGTLTDFDAGKTDLYQSRNRDWYAANGRANDLYNSFNRFNFFNSDAAHNFSNADTEKEARDALFSIILGPEFHYISERCERSLDKLRPDYNKLADQMLSYEQKKLQAERVIKDYKEPESFTRLRDTIQEAFQQFKFKTPLSSDDPVLVEEKINTLVETISSLVKADNHILTLEDFREAWSKFEAKRTELDNKQKELGKLNEKQTDLQAQIKQLDSSFAFITRCISYVQDEQLMELENLQIREVETNLLNSKMTQAKELLSQINTSRTDLIHGEKDSGSKLLELKEQMEKNEVDMSALVTSFSKIDGVVKQIKSLGKEFLSIDTTSCDCPLCQASYSRAELTDRLLKELSSDSVANPPQSFDDLRLRIEDQKMAIQKIEQVQQDRRKLLQAYNVIVPGEAAGFDVMLEKLDQFLAESPIISDRQTRLATLKAYAESSGYSEKEFKELQFACKQFYEDRVSFTYGQSETFTELQGEITQEISQSKKELEETIASRASVGNGIKRLLGVEGGGTPLYLKDVQNMFQKEEVVMLKIKSAFDNLNSLVALEDNTSVNYLSESAAILLRNISSFRAEQKLQFEYETAIQDEATASQFISDNQQKLARYKHAVKVLQELTGTQAAQQVARFFDDNFQEIIDIFKAIHVPKEFKTLKYEHNRLELITENNESRSISQISTGQRSALALSIFLSLNAKLKNGPNLIMFDDPVAFIDDFNALSFLDYLRVYTLNSGKQIFFATANMRLAGLFEKKFSFLDDDFKKFEFKRRLLDEPVS